MSAAIDARGASGVASAGGRLREAREAAGLSVDAVAQQLKLAPRQIRAIEEDDWQHLPGRTFIRGFARNYARFLHLDPDAVLAMLPAPETDPALGRPALRTDTRPMGEIPAEREPSRASSMRFLLPLVLIAIVAAVAYYELSRAPLRMPEWLSTRIGAFNQGAPDEATSSALPTSPASPSTTSQAPAAGALSVAPKVLGSEPETPSAASNADGASTPTPAASPSAPAATAETPATAPASAATSAQPTSGGDVALVLTFRGSSWAEVKDANGRVVLQMTGGAGMTQTVNALPPLEVALGNAPAVDVTFRGQPLDLAPYTRGSVARVGLK